MKTLFQGETIKVIQGVVGQVEMDDDLNYWQGEVNRKPDMIEFIDIENGNVAFSFVPIAVTKDKDVLMIDRYGFLGGAWHNEDRGWLYAYVSINKNANIDKAAKELTAFIKENNELKEINTKNIHAALGQIK